MRMKGTYVAAGDRTTAQVEQHVCAGTITDACRILVAVNPGGIVVSDQNSALRKEERVVLTDEHPSSPNHPQSCRTSTRHRYG